MSMDAYCTLTHPLLFHTTLWFFCLAFLHPLKRRPRFWPRLTAAMLLVVLAGTVPLLVPLPSLLSIVTHYLAVLILVALCCQVNFFQACYAAVWIQVTHQLTIECWIIFYHFVRKTNDLGGFFIPIGLFCCALICVVLGCTICRWLPQDGAYRIGPRQFALAIGLLIFFEFNYWFLFLEHTYPYNIIFLLSLPPAQFYCVCTLYFQNTLFRKSELKQELEILHRLRHEQQLQYDLSKENIAIINRKCHDLKHQMAAMRTMVSPEYHEKYLAEIEKSVRIYDSILKTGNEVLDTVLTEKSLYCESNQITIHCIADGSQLGFMDPVDLYTVFGNALDNAIESVQQLQLSEQRMIDVLICTEKNCLVVQVRNPVSETLTFVDGLPKTTKGDTDYHGYGLKSIRHTVTQYGGHMVVKAEDGWFALKILIPLDSP